MTQTLGEVVAVEKTARQSADKQREELLRRVQRKELFAGFSQVYKHDQHDPEGLHSQPEKTEVLQERTPEILAELARVLTPALDLSAAKEYANTAATADVVLDEEDQVPLLRDVPVTYLLPLEHQLGQVLGFFRALQVRDPSELWDWDEDDGSFRSRHPEQRLRVEKGLKSLVLIEPTQYQAGQAQAVPDEKRTGVWEITRFSGALSREDKLALIERCERLIGAVHQARVRANQAEAGRVSVAGPVFSYLLG